MITKFRAEMEQYPNDSYIQVVGNFLIDYLRKHPGAEPADKTIKGSLAEMKREAQRNQSGGVGVLTDEEGFAIVLQYFGLDSEPQRPAGLVVSLDDLL